MNRMVRPFSIIATAVALMFTFIGAAYAQVAHVGGYAVALGEARLTAPSSAALLPSTTTGPVADVGLFALGLGFAAILAAFTLLRRFQSR